MLVLVSYDVNTEDMEGTKRLRRVAKVCQNFGQRVQYSVFECLIDPAEWIALRHKLVQEIAHDRDSIRFYFLGANWKRRVEHIGIDTSYDPEGPLVV
jgi:CRISPR-associated protein Cas2